MLTQRAHKHIEGAIFDVRGTAEVDQLHATFSVKYDILVLDIAVNDARLDMKMVHSVNHLAEDVFAFHLFHIRPKLNVVEKIHAGNTVWEHLDVVVEAVLEKIDHLYDVRVLHLGRAEIV